MTETFNYIKNLLTEKSKSNELTVEEKEILNKISEHDGFFSITSVHRDDLNAIGFETRNVSDSTMGIIAAKLANDYCGQLFHESLEFIAENEGIQRATNPKYEFIKKDATVMLNGEKVIVTDAPQYSIDDETEITVLQNEEEFYVEAIELIPINKD